MVPAALELHLHPADLGKASFQGEEEGRVDHQFLLLRHPPDAPLEVTTNAVTFAYAIASNHRRRLAAAIVPTPYAAAKDTA